jgi:hypothetical protein
MLTLASFLPYGSKCWNVAVLKAYYDCGNKLDSREYKTVTLAGVYGSADEMDEFEKIWTSVLAKHEAGHLHTTDALALRGVHGRDKGWTPEKVTALIVECVGVIGKSVERGLGLVSCTLNLNAYKSAKRQMPDLASPEHICVTYCLGVSLVRHQAKFPEDTTTALFFDRGEPFYGHIRNLWNRKALRSNSTWASIVQIGEVDTRRSPALQAADLIAWSLNRAAADNTFAQEWQRPLLLDIRRDSKFMNEDYFRQERIAENVKKLNSLNLPKRKPML